MLAREHAIAEYDRGRINPDRLTQREHAHYLAYSKRMLLVYQRSVGRTRQELHRDVHHIFAGETDCPTRRIDAFCKLLDDVSTYDTAQRGRAAALRRSVYKLAAPNHPLVRSADQLFEQEEKKVKSQIAAQVGRSWDEIERDLFADVMEFHRLKSFEGYPDAAALLARYNVAQVQVALFGAIGMTVWAAQDFKTILRYAKLARLMHTIRHAGAGRYEIRFDGPASVLRQTRRYGTAMAKFLPALIACQGWRLHAIVQTPRGGWTAGLDLSPSDRLNSHLPAPNEFDSDVEATFAERWGSEKRHGWTMIREGEILHQGQKVFTPDFAFRHDSGRTILVEIIGFWTPEYLQAKLQTLRLFASHPILLAVSEQAAIQMPDLPANAIRFKTVLKLQDVLEALEADRKGNDAICPLISTR